ncbi:MAG: DUF2269 family protein [Acidimicrobiia bacterium]
MYRWWVFIHLVGVVGFLAAHGTSIAATWFVRRIREPAKVAGVLQLSAATVGFFYLFTFLLLLGGIAAGISGNWFGQAWIWVSLVLFVVTSVAMFPLARSYFNRIRQVLDLIRAGTTVSEDEFERVLQTGQPALIAGTGVVIIIFIVYLMVQKPF